MPSNKTMATALAYIAITDSKRCLKIDTKIAANEFITFDAGASSDRVYTVNEAGMALARTSKLWKAHKCLVRLGFGVHIGRKFRPAHIPYRHPEQVETVHGRTWRCGFTGKHGNVYADMLTADRKIVLTKI